MKEGKKLSSEECEAPAEAWINGANGTVNRTEQRIANLMQMLEHNRESQVRNLQMVAMNHQAVHGLQSQLMFLQEQLVHLECTEKSLKAQEEILKRQSSDLEGKNSHTK
jgi:chromosome segregation ATPase